MKYNICKETVHTLGVQVQGEITTFSVQNHWGKASVLLLYPRDGGDVIRISMEEMSDWAGVYAVSLTGKPLEYCDYLYELEGNIFLDPYATRITGREKWADFTENGQEIKCGIYNDGFRWKQDKLPRIPKEDMFIYRAHVRGFSMQLKRLPSKEQGTFQAIERRLPYLQELGVTTLELMPVYEFEERTARDPYYEKKRRIEPVPEDRVNYWGYTEGNYFAPKASYLGAGLGAKSLKRLVAKLHQRGMECILEFYFDDNLNPHFIFDVLHYWAREYHVDGFHLICKEQAAKLVAQDPYLSGRKLFYQWFSDEEVSGGRYQMEIFSYNEGFLYGVRRFANQQGGKIREFVENIRRQHKDQGFVNFLAWNNGFTLYDSLAYTEKHNQGNGQENRDGNAWNYSVNCGEEGVSRKRNVQVLRERQTRNLLSVLMLSQGVPMIWMGDECGNSQGGNNNAYCQDNEIGWKDWSNTKKSRELYQFLCRLSQLRRRYPALRSREPMRQMDYLRCGYPDLSYHGCDGWQMELEGNDRAIGMLYCTKYVTEKEKWEELKDNFIYIGYNFSETSQNLALPVLPRGFGWYMVLDTSQEDAFGERVLGREGRNILLPHHTVCMLVGRREEAK